MLLGQNCKSLLARANMRILARKTPTIQVFKRRGECFILFITSWSKILVFDKYPVL